MIRVRSIALNVLTAMSLLLPLVLSALEGRSPLHIRGTRVWVYYNLEVRIAVPDGSGFRTIASVSWLLMVPALLLFPLMWIRHQWRLVADRKTFLFTLFLSLVVSWIPLIMILDGPREAQDRFEIAISSFFFVCVLAVLLWLPARAVIYMSNYPQRRRQSRLAGGLCVQCGYSLHGNVSGVCPECGHPISTIESSVHP